MTSPVFLSYSHKDRPTVARIASDLHALDVPVWWDKWELKVGDSLTQKIEQGIDGAGYLCVVLSQASVQSDWVKRELTAGYVRELEGKSVFVLPLLLEPCQIPLFLRDKVYADFSSSYEAGFATLIERVAPRIDPHIAGGLSSEDVVRVEAAVRLISEKDRPVYVHWLQSRLLSNADVERRAAIVALHELSVPDLLGHLLAMAKDESSSIRRLVAIYLGMLSHAAGSSTLHELTQDKVSGVRAAARDALKKLDR